MNLVQSITILKRTIFFVIAMVHVNENNRQQLKKSHKRFVTKNMERLMCLDEVKIDSKTGKVLRDGNKMFRDGKFIELKGSQFDREMKIRFVEFMVQKPCFDIFYIKLDNRYLTDTMCSNSARAFNYPIKLALESYIKRGYLPKAKYNLQLDERNERPDARFFLNDYLNTELIFNKTVDEEFETTYYDSANNIGVQIADVFSNLYYSKLMTGKYNEEFQLLKDTNILKQIFTFPLKNGNN